MSHPMNAIPDFTERDRSGEYVNPAVCLECDAIFDPPPAVAPYYVEAALCEDCRAAIAKDQEASDEAA